MLNLTELVPPSRRSTLTSPRLMDDRSASGTGLTDESTNAALVQLARGVSWDCLDDHQPAGQLVPREVFRSVVPNIVQGDRGARLQGDDGDHGLAPLLIRHTDHGYVAQPGEVRQGTLDLGRVHVLPTGDDHVLEPVDDEQAFILVEVADVAGMEPALCIEGSTGRLWVLPVARSDVRAPDGGLAALALGHRLVVAGENHDLGVGH